MAYHPTRKLTILALDPSVRTDGRILRAQIEVPNEVLEPGPRGYRVFIVDYDSSADAFRTPGKTFRQPGDSYRTPGDPFEHLADAIRATITRRCPSWVGKGVAATTVIRFTSYTAWQVSRRSTASTG